MDLSAQQVQDIQEIEKQIGPDQQVPKILSQKQEKNRSVFTNVLTALGISVGATAAIIIILAIPVSKKPLAPQPTYTTSTVQVAQSPNITVTSEYVNPFSTTAQYSNPFTATQNPFAHLSP